LQIFCQKTETEKNKKFAFQETANKATAECQNDSNKKYSLFFLAYKAIQ
jgi:hypothetical protein